MTENEAYIQLLIMLSLILSLPFFYRVCYTIGKIVMVKYFPPKYVNIEVVENNETTISKVNIDDNKALIDALLKSTGRKLY
ncbi:hypothetical protein [Shewanella sp. ENK2]|uniref:hypothetical protein n=1 Tax=Shewanella sp. ENK2 TaxID=2775245 RepID=UPI003749FFAE